MDGVLDVRPELDVVEVGRRDGLERETDRQSERADGVPHADDFDRHVARARRLERGRRGRVGLPLPIRGVGIVAGHAGVFADEADAPQHPGHAARLEGAAAEAEDVDLIAVLVPLDDEVVAALNAVVDAVAGGGGEGVSAHADAVGEELHLAIVVDRCFEDPADVGVDAAGDVRVVRAVKADDDVLAHGGPPGWMDVRRFYTV